MKQILTLFILTISYMLCGAQATSLTVDNQTPGWLSSKINYGDQQTVENLTVSGFLNGTDIRFIRELNTNNSLNGVIDLSDAKIVAGGDAYYYENSITQSGARYTSTDVIGEYMFSGLKQISKLKLPKTIKSIKEGMHGHVFGGTQGSMGIDSLIVDCPNLRTLGGFGAPSEVRYLYIGEGIEDVDFGYLFHTYYNEYVKQGKMELNLPSTIKKLYAQCLISSPITIWSNVVNPTGLEARLNDGRLIFQKGTIYIPENSTDLYKNSVFYLMTIIENIYPEEVKFHQNNIDLYVGDITSVSYTILPENSIHNALKWQSSNPDIVQVDQSGKISALSFGEAKICASTANNIESYCNIHVYEHVESIEVPENLMLEIGENKNLSVLVKPEGKTNNEVIWETLDSSIATVDNKGNVKGISNGQCTITATTIDGGHTAECLVNVIQPVESVDVTPNSLSLIVGENALLSVSILPVNANDKSVIWTSEDESIAKVDQTGNVIAMAGGKTKIFAISNYDNSVKDFCEVSAMQPVTGVLLNQNTAEITVDGSLQLVATVLPDNSTNKNVTWNSSDVSVAMVSGNGIVYGIKPGQATIMATTEDGGFSALCKVIVKEGFIPISEIKLNQTSIDGNIGDSYKLAASIFPENASNKTLVWQSDNEGVASVDNDGLVKLLNSGVVMIKASATDGSGAYSECKITVNKVLVSSITLSETAKEMAVGEEFQLVATILPGNATSKNIEWKSMNETIATVDSQGVVRALKEGECEISVTACDESGTTASCKVIVGMDSAIDDITVDNQEGVMIYSVQGLLLFKGQYIARPYLSNGVYILTTESGKTVKLIIKN